MTKGELIAAIGQRFPQLSHRQADQIVDTVFAVMTHALTQGERIELRGFGGLSIKARPSRTARNPRTGAAVQIPAQRVPAFKVGKELRDRLNGNNDK